MNYAIYYSHRPKVRLARGTNYIVLASPIKPRSGSMGGQSACSGGVLEVGVVQSVVHACKPASNSPRRCRQPSETKACPVICGCHGRAVPSSRSELHDARSGEVQGQHTTHTRPFPHFDEGWCTCDDRICREHDVNQPALGHGVGSCWVLLGRYGSCWATSDRWAALPLKIVEIG